MKRVSLLALLLLTVACSPKVSGPPKKCGQKPADFHFTNLELSGDPGPPMFNVVKIFRTAILQWNGEASDLKTVETYLIQTGNMAPQPVIMLDFEAGAPCYLVDEVRKSIRVNLDCKGSRICGQGPTWR